ncbi:nitrilase-related carbon-nitrogen hydrolase, partial [Thermoflexus sp.]|uniref:nitrilase-related carbon-nitrogen hydrolase n=1 Tax=Thermoflexus sp. TaxID=1969742 RepID=UPI0035E45A9F
MENGVWVAVANKVGMEAESVLYCGRSGVIGPDGQYRAMGSPDREEIVLAEVDLHAAPGPRIQPSKPDPLMTAPVAALPVAARLQEPFPPQAACLRLGLLQLKPHAPMPEWIRRLTELGEILVRQGADLVVVSGSPTGPADQALEALQAFTARWPCGLAVPLPEGKAAGEGPLAIYLLDRGQLVGVRRGSGREGLAVHSIAGVAIGTLLGSEGWAPEIARGLMLRGAELLVWWVAAPEPGVHTVARARADENRVFVALAAPVEGSEEAATAVFDPLGNPLATGAPGVEHGLLVSLFRPLTRHKEMAPGSHVVFSRNPAAFWSEG